MVIGVVAATRCVCLCVSPQRFTMAVDPLTLRLFNKLRLQHSATAVFSNALSHVDQRQHVLDKCRDVSLGPSAA